MSDTLLPPNATATEKNIEAATARVGSMAVPVRDLWNPQTCPASLLPWLAWALSVDNWDKYWDEATKRSVIAASISVHYKKGTVGAVKEARDTAAGVFLYRQGGRSPAADQLPHHPYQLEDTRYHP